MSVVTSILVDLLCGARTAATNFRQHVIFFFFRPPRAESWARLKIEKESVARAVNNANRESNVTMLVLYETPAGYALFKVLDEKKLSNVENLYKHFQQPEHAAALYFFISLFVLTEKTAFSR